MNFPIADLLITAMALQLLHLNISNSLFIMENNHADVRIALFRVGKR